MVPVACCHILFFLPFPTGVESLLTVCGAAVVGAFMGLWSVVVAAALAVLWWHEALLASSPAAQQV